MKKLTEELKNKIESGCKNFGLHAIFRDNIGQFATITNPESNIPTPSITWFSLSKKENKLEYVLDPKIILTTNPMSVDETFKYVELCGKMTAWIESVKIIYDMIEE